ncbi:MAG TPA: radical SAM protein [bacterium]|nr:radical SAM protein [bacterium]HQI47075.1 radical SAM protein [bacterium]HQJ65368.1 radical SAM protein [bacterium]
MQHSISNTRLPWLVVSGAAGQIFEIPGLEMAGMRLREQRLPDPAELIPLPFGSALFQLPQRRPIGYDRSQDQFLVLDEFEGQPVFAVGAFIAPAYTQILLAAYQSPPGAEPLPLFAYSAVGWRGEQFITAGVRVDSDIRQDPAYFNGRLIEQQAAALLARFPGNRLVEHLVENCVRRYACPAAQNLALGRWEAPIPTSPACNARCVGCISKQNGTCVPETQQRIRFVPTPEEIAEYTVPHLETAPRPVVSFGQGCEGEPLLQGELLEAAIRLIRSRTASGTINLNTNASRPEVIDRLCVAGLDSLRVSLNSARPDYYRAYYRPAGYDWPEVAESLRIARRHKRWISLNYFIFPGFTDDREEIAALIDLVRDHKIDYIQMRNLNIDPEWYCDALGLGPAAPHAVGILSWMEQIRTKAPWIRFGYFNPPKEEWQAA